MAKQLSNAELLQNKEIVEEIKRHLWIESEKAGHDIGFENAAKDWLQKYSKAWLDYHSPRAKGNAGKTNGKKILKEKSRVKAKSYL